MTDLVQAIRKNPFILAPMAGITDVAFRSVMRAMGSPVVVTELVSANGLHYASDKTKKLMEFGQDQRPVGIQIFGETLENLAEAAVEIQKMGADFVDLNFGCPVKKVVSKGAGSAILKDLVRVREVFQAVKGAVDIPVTVKIRTGWDETTRNADEVIRIAYEEKLTWVAIHGRTRAAGYTGQADWDYIKAVKAGSPLPIIGNGDITCPKMAVQRLTESGCDAVMIGRGCLKNPWLFLEAMAQLKGETYDAEKNYSELLKTLIAEYLNKFDERTAHLQLKKFSAWYSSGFADASQFRKNIFQTKSFEETHQVALNFFSHIKNQQPRDTSHEEFLMGGHG